MFDRFKIFKMIVWQATWNQWNGATAIQRTHNAMLGTSNCVAALFVYHSFKYLVCSIRFRANDRVRMKQPKRSNKCRESMTFQSQCSNHTNETRQMYKKHISRQIVSDKIVLPVFASRNVHISAVRKATSRIRFKKILWNNWKQDSKRTVIVVTIWAFVRFGVHHWLYTNFALNSSLPPSCQRHHCQRHRYCCYCYCCCCC